jgi:DNA polymerase III epsilon subunit family exonuclease
LLARQDAIVENPPADTIDLAAATVQQASADGGRYAFLIQRAMVYIRERGGVVHQDELITHVFGSGSDPTLWRSLLQGILTTEEELALGLDGIWRLDQPQASPESPLLAEFVALDVETTGLRPLHQRVIEIAAVRYRDGSEIERFETLLNPEKRIPAFISDLTGIKNADVAGAPRFAMIANDLTQFLGASLIVGHNVGFDLSFVNAELKRLSLPQLVNDRLDVMYLGMKLLPGLRRPSLDKLAIELGLNPRKIHRAARDAVLAAEAAICLQRHAADQGHSTPERFMALAAPARRQPKDDVGRGRAVLDRSLLADIPKKPGVYIMRDAYDHVIYVGKAKNLRDRVSSYYSQPLGYTRKMDGLLESMVKIDAEITGSELEALLLESQLIKRYQPRYNTAMRSFEQYPYIKVDLSNPWPRVTLARERLNDGARYFGPYRSKSAAKKTVDLINANVPLRTCTRTFKNARSFGSPCIQLDLGRCLGPCVGRADRDEYRALVHEVIDFLDGDSDALFARLWQGLEDAAARLDFEKARRLRNDLQSVHQLVDAQSSLRAAQRQHTLLLVLPSAQPRAREVLLVVEGRLWAQFQADRYGGKVELAEKLARSWQRMRECGVPPIDHATLDETNILNRWLLRYAGHPAMLSLDLALDEPDWSALAARALALTNDELEFNLRNDDEGNEDVVTDACDSDLDEPS